MQLSFITPAKAVACPRIWRDFSCEDIRHAQLTISGLGLYRADQTGKPPGGVAGQRLVQGPAGL